MTKNQIVLLKQKESKAIKRSQQKELEKQKRREEFGFLGTFDLIIPKLELLNTKDAPKYSENSKGTFDSEDYLKNFLVPYIKEKISKIPNFNPVLLKGLIDFYLDAAKFDFFFENFSPDVDLYWRLEGYGSKELYYTIQLGANFLYKNGYFDGEDYSAKNPKRLRTAFVKMREKISDGSQEFEKIEFENAREGCQFVWDFLKYIKI